MKKKLAPCERLIVAADFDPPEDEGRFWVERAVTGLAQKLAKTGVTLKVNSALRACGYGLIDQIHSYGLGVFADLKLYDIPNTLATDGAFLHRSKPELLTTVCSAGVKAMSTLRLALPDTEVLGVTVLTSLDQADVRRFYSRSMDSSVLMFAEEALAAGIGGWICSPKEATILRTLSKEMTINTPAIRPAWYRDPKDDQNPERIMTSAKAITAGADRIVVGRPILTAPDPYDAVMRTIEEISSATA